MRGSGSSRPHRRFSQRDSLSSLHSRRLKLKPRFIFSFSSHHPTPSTSSPEDEIIAYLCPRSRLFNVERSLRKSDEVEEELGVLPSLDPFSHLAPPLLLAGIRSPRISSLSRESSCDVPCPYLRPKAKTDLLGFPGSRSILSTTRAF